jgi:Mce-associated membrane protein
MSGRTTGVLAACLLVPVTALAGEAWYLWGAPSPTASAVRPVTIGDIEARTVVDIAAQDAAAIFTTSWRSYDAHLTRVSALMTQGFAAQYRSSAAPVRARMVASRMRTSTKVANSAVVRATPDRVLALLFLDQRTSAGRLAPSYDSRRALVTMVHTDQGWLVDNVQTQ